MSVDYRRIWRWILTALVVWAIMFLLSACSATGGALTVKTAVPVACLEKEPDRPSMPTESLKPGGPLFDSVIAMQAEIEVREGYEARLVTALRACIKPVETRP